MKRPHILLTILVVVLIGQTVYFYPKLPDIIASHFNAAGQVNGFMAKTSFFLLEGALVGFILLISLLMEKLLSFLPNSMINVPNKEYWLAPERRAETLASFGEFFAWFGSAIVALFIGVNQIALSANLSKKDPDPTGFIVVLVIFLIVMIVLMTTHLRRFLSMRQPS